MNFPAVSFAFANRLYTWTPGWGQHAIKEPTPMIKTIPQSQPDYITIKIHQLATRTDHGGQCASVWRVCVCVLYCPIYLQCVLYCPIYLHYSSSYNFIVASFCLFLQHLDPWYLWLSDANRKYRNMCDVLMSKSSLLEAKLKQGRGGTMSVPFCIET